ncbi:MAG: substrate-binding domain-containing protein, partial [Rubrivivax sp.]
RGHRSSPGRLALVCIATGRSTMTPPLRLLSSMATRAWLADILPAYQGRPGSPVHAESVGGVDAARRVRSGEPVDLVFLASDAIEALVAEGHLRDGSVVPVVRSEVSLAVGPGSALALPSSEAALRQAVLDAPSLGYSTGPSGTQLLKLFERWGIVGELGTRLVQAPPGVPVARLLAEGTVALGFQQTSELIHTPGVRVLGPLPDACAITTVFSAAVGVSCGQPEVAAGFLQWLASEETAASKRVQGLAPA